MSTNRRTKPGQRQPSPSVRDKKKVSNRKVASLHNYSRQGQMFTDMSDSDLKLLAESMRSGLDEPIEILPDGTIISGHQRVRAAKLLKWDTIRCWVRHDLAKQGPESVEKRFIEANFNRRQLGPLDKARCYRRLLELDRNKPRCNGKLKGDLRDYIAKQFGFSGRNLERWVKLLDTPLEIQRAVEQKKLKLVMGVNVAALPKDTQEEIASKIREGVEPKEAVAEHCATKSSQPTPETAYRRLRRSLEQLVPVLDTDIEDVDLQYYRHDLPLLRRSKKLHRALIARIEKTADTE